MGTAWCPSVIAKLVKYAVFSPVRATIFSDESTAKFDMVQYTFGQLSHAKFGKWVGRKTPKLENLMIIAVFGGFSPRKDDDIVTAQAEIWHGRMYRIRNGL